MLKNDPDPDPASDFDFRGHMSRLVGRPLLFGLFVSQQLAMKALIPKTMGCFVVLHTKLPFRSVCFFQKNKAKRCKPECSHVQTLE